jgi:hypothetical protein
MKTDKIILHAPRWMPLETEMKNLAFELDVKATVEVDKFLLWKTLRVTVHGEERAVKSFMRIVRLALENYQKRLELA